MCNDGILMNVYVMTDDNGWQDEQKIQIVTSFFYMYKATNINKDYPT